MKNFAINKFLITLFTFCCAFAFAFACFSFGDFSSSVKADGTASAKLFLPNTDLEYYSLKDPIDVYSDQTVTAIVQSDQTLIIYFNGAFNRITSFTSIKQVKKLDQQTLLVSDNGSIYKINLSNFSKDILTDSDNQIVGGNYFDVNENYLVTAFGKNATVYSINNGALSNTYSFPVKDDKPIAINDDDLLFYIKDISGDEQDKLFKGPISNLASHSVIDSVKVPSKMIAKGDFLFYIVGTEIHRLSLSDSSDTKLTILKDDNYELSSLPNPSSIVFKGDNLLVTDTDLDAVQEFAVQGDSLKFTGFAIASDKTAYNRTTANALQIEKHGDSFAVLDQNKLSVFSPVDSDVYTHENYADYFANDLGGLMPQAFALGNGYALLSYNHGTFGNTLTKLNLADNSLSNFIKVENGYAVKDLCYQSGTFYIVATSGNDFFVYAINEKTDFNNDVSEANLLFDATDGNSFTPTLITADVFGNVYLAQQTGLVKLYDKSNGYESSVVAEKANLTKLSTDLSGKLFALSDGQLFYLDGSSFSSLQLTHPQNLDKIKSFAMDYDKKEVFLIYNDKEYVAVTNTLNNLALSDVAVPQEYVTTSQSALLNDLQFATVKDGANLYSVVKNQDGFDYLGLTDKKEEYVVLCDVKVDQSLTLTALAEKNGVILVNAKEVNKYAPVQEQAPSVAFITTGVCAYYLPIISPNGDYALKKDGNAIRLNKQSEIKPTAKITVNTMHNGQTSKVEFYFAELVSNGTILSGYIPVSFTVPVLSKNVVFENYSIETVGKTTLYLNQDLTGEFSVLNGDNVRLFSINNGVASVAYLTDSGWVRGYISASAILNKPNVAVRNILIILAVAASVCGTTTYFVLRKKETY